MTPLEVLAEGWQAYLAAGVALTVLVTTAHHVTKASREARRREEDLRRASSRRQFINKAAVWWGYPSPEEPVPPLPTLHFRYALDEEEIPPGLHAQHRLAGEERARGRRARRDEDG